MIQRTYPAFLLGMIAISAGPLLAASALDGAPPAEENETPAEAAALLAPNENRWVTAGQGSWSDPANWLLGVPAAQSEVFIDNGGTAVISSDIASPSIIYLGGAQNGSLQHLAGTWDGSTIVEFVSPPAAASLTGSTEDFLAQPITEAEPSKFTIGGAAIARLYRFRGEDQLVEQSGGALQLTYVGLRGRHTQSNGELLVTYEFQTYAGSLFELTGGTVDIVNDRVTLRGDYLQTGGTLSTQYATLIRNDGVVRIEGGEADLKNVKFFQGGRIEAAGGTLMIAKPYLNPADNRNPAGMLDVSGGTLALTNGVSSGSAPMTFQASPWTLDVRAGIANVANAQMPDVSRATLLTAPDSLTILPAGVSPGNFAGATLGGLVHTAGSRLSIPVGTSVQGLGTIDDAVLVAGELVAFDATPDSSTGPSILLPGGVRVADGGVARLGGGEVTITDQDSGVFGGELRARKMFVGRPGQPGRFTMTGGLFDDGDTSSAAPEFFIGRETNSVGEVFVSGGVLKAQNLWIGGEGQGAFTQTGGEVELGFSSGSAPIVAENGHYQLDGGSLSSSQLAVTGTFTQTAGDHLTRSNADIGVQPTGGTYHLDGGTHTVSDLAIGRYQDSSGRYTVDTGGTLNVTRLTLRGSGHGVLEVAGGEVTIFDANIGEYGPSYELWLHSADAKVRVLRELELGPSAGVSVAHNATLNLAGDLKITSTDPAKLSDLRKLRLVVENEPNEVSLVEVAGSDLGANPAGFANNFSLLTLQIGDEKAGYVRLTDLFDNRSAGEALYVENLILGPGSTLDLNGLNLYYVDLQRTRGSTLLLNGGSLTQVAAPVPEPASTSVLLGLAVGALFCRRRGGKRLVAPATPVGVTPPASYRNGGGARGA